MTPYQKLVAARKCTQCRRPLLEREKKKCELCIEANRARRITDEGRARDRGYARKSYAKDPEAKRQAVRAEKDRKKREHECRDCPNPAEPDADHCAVHTEKRRKYAQRVWRKTKARRTKERKAMALALRLPQCYKLGMSNTAERSPVRVRSDIATPTPGSGCGGRGYHRHFDTDYDCGGCFACGRATAQAAWYAGAFLFQMANHAEIIAADRACSAMEHLAAIGTAIRAALGLGRAIAYGLSKFVSSWNIPARGAWYRVTGTRGNASNYRGKIGECKWCEVQEYRSQFGTWSRGSSWRLGLKLDGIDALIYVNGPAVERIAPPADLVAARDLAIAEALCAKMQRDAIASVRPPFAGKVGKRGDVGCVIEGPHKGSRGVVFWRGAGRGRDADVERVGLKTEGGATLWCNSRDVVGPAKLAGDIAGDVAERLMVMLTEAGHDAEAIAYGDIVRRIEGKPPIVPEPVVPAKAKRARKPRKGSPPVDAAP